MKKICNWLKRFYNEYYILVCVGIIFGLVGLLCGVIIFSIDNHKDNVIDSVTEYVKTEDINGHRYITLRQKVYLGKYNYHVLHDPDCNCLNN